MKTIIHAVHIHAAPPQVYEALTTSEGLCQWWTTQVAVETGPGGIIRFTFHGDFHPHMQQTALEPHRLVRWSCVAGHPNWQNKHVLIHPRRTDRVRRHCSSSSSTLKSCQMRHTARTTSTGVRNSLKLYCETGTGTP